MKAKDHNLMADVRTEPVHGGKIFCFEHHRSEAYVWMQLYWPKWLTSTIFKTKIFQTIVHNTHAKPLGGAGAKMLLCTHAWVCKHKQKRLYKLLTNLDVIPTYFSIILKNFPEVHLLGSLVSLPLQKAILPDIFGTTRFCGNAHFDYPNTGILL